MPWLNSVHPETPSPLAGVRGMKIESINILGHYHPHPDPPPSRGKIRVSGWELNKPSAIRNRGKINSI
jgi:hypothetical protein